jgi:putative nucleotidyltransferase with HDIG domain
MIEKNKILEKLSSFQTLPVIAQRILAVVSDPDADASDVAKVISLDLALTANVLKAANSAYFGFARPVSSLTEASFRLGAGWVSQIAVLSMVYTNFKHPATGYGQSAEDLWRHSAAVAVTSDNLCRLLRLKESRSVFTAAIVHDIGKLVLEEFVSDHLEGIQRYLSEHQVTFERAEREVMGFDHAEVGAMVAENWRFPEELVQAVRWHHEPNSAQSGQRVVDVVHIADSLCIMQGIGLGHDGMLYRPSPEAMERLNITSNTIETITSQLLDSLEGIERILAEAPKNVSVRR